MEWKNAGGGSREILQSSSPVRGQVEGASYGFQSSHTGRKSVLNRAGAVPTMTLPIAPSQPGTKHLLPSKTLKNT